MVSTSTSSDRAHSPLRRAFTTRPVIEQMRVLVVVTVTFQAGLPGVIVTVRPAFRVSGMNGSGTKTRLALALYRSESRMTTVLVPYLSEMLTRPSA